jgi:hypothetical protein
VGDDLVSIWTTTFSDEVPVRDNYTGEPTTGHPHYLDVATAKGWHDGVRLCAGGGAIVLSRDVARDLGLALVAAAMDV